MQWTMGAAAVASLVLAVGCGGVASGSKSGAVAGSTGGAPGDAGRGTLHGGGAGSASTDAGSVTSADDGGPLAVLDHFGPMPAGPVQLAFKSAYAWEEQIWLRETSGAIVQVSSWARSARIGSSFSWSSGGYPEGSGRFGLPRFDHTGRFLLFRETLDDTDRTAPGLERMVAFELSTGHATELFRAPRNSIRSPVVGQDATALVVEATGSAPTVYEFVSGTASPVELPAVTPLAASWGGPRILELAGHPLLLADGVPPLEKTSGGWAPSTALSGVVGKVWDATVSPAGDRLCLVTDAPAVPAVDAGPSASAFIVGGPAVERLPADSYDYCMFAPDPAVVLLHNPHGGTTAYLPDGTRSFRADGAEVCGVAGGKLYAMKGDELVVLDPADGSTASAVLAGAGPAAGCGGPGSGAGQIVRVLLPRGENQTALVKVSCQCTDCDISGTLAVRLDSSQLTVVEAVNGEHSTYGALRLASDAFVVASTQGRDPDPVPAAGSLFVVHQQGDVELVGPLPHVDGDIHAPTTPGPDGLVPASDWWVF